MGEDPENYINDDEDDEEINLKSSASVKKYKQTILIQSQELEELKKYLKETEKVSPPLFEKSNSNFDQESKDINEKLLNINETLKLEISQMKLQLKEQETEINELQYTENIFVESSQVLKNEITMLNRKLRAKSDSTARSDIKDALLNWVDYFQKG